MNVSIESNFQTQIHKNLRSETYTSGDSVSQYHIH